jgi:hypothetical protein
MLNVTDITISNCSVQSANPSEVEIKSYQRLFVISLPLAGKDKGLGTERWRVEKHQGYFVLAKSPFCRGRYRDNLGCYTYMRDAKPALGAE